MAEKETTTQHFKENVWIKKFPSSGKDLMQLVNICIHLENDTFANLSALYFYDGIYYNGNNPLGTIDDANFLDYIEKLTGINNSKGHAAESISDKPFLSADEICEIYQNTQSIKKTSREAGFSEEKIKKILIKKGVYTSKKYKQIKALLEQGKSLKEISEELKISMKQLQVFIPKAKKIKDIT